MPYICYRLDFFDGQKFTTLTNYHQYGYISIDGGPFKKLYHGAVFEVSEGLHCISTANHCDLDTVALAHAVNNKLEVNTCSCTPASNVKEDYAGQDKLLFSKGEVKLLLVCVASQYGCKEPYWGIRNWSSTTPSNTGELSKFLGMQITDGRSFLSQRATYLSGPIDWDKVNARPVFTTPQNTPAYTSPEKKTNSVSDPARELRRKRRKRKKLLKKIAIGIACAAAAGLILWWLIDVLEPLFSQLAETAKDMK